jgi:hypothetical protein
MSPTDVLDIANGDYGTTALLAIIILTWMGGRVALATIGALIGKDANQKEELAMQDGTERQWATTIKGLTQVIQDTITGLQRVTDVQQELVTNIKSLNVQSAQHSQFTTELAQSIKVIAEYTSSLAAKSDQTLDNTARALQRVDEIKSELAKIKGLVEAVEMRITSQDIPVEAIERIEAAQMAILARLNDYLAGLTTEPIGENAK